MRSEATHRTEWTVQDSALIVDAHRLLRERDAHTNGTAFDCAVGGNCTCVREATAELATMQWVQIYSISTNSIRTSMERSFPIIHTQIRHTN